MRLRRLTLRLPPSMKHTAHHDARRIAEALAQTLHANGGQVANVTLNARGQSSAILAGRVAAALPKGGKNGR